MSGSLPADVRLEPRLGPRASARRQRVTIGSDVPIWTDVVSILTGALVPGATGASAIYWAPGTAGNEAAAQPLDVTEITPGTLHVRVPGDEPGTYLMRIEIDTPTRAAAEIVFDRSSLGDVTLTSAGTIPWGEVQSVAAAAAVSAARPEARAIAQQVGAAAAAPFADAALRFAEQADLARRDARSDANAALGAAASVVVPERFYDPETKREGFVWRDTRGTILIFLNQAGEFDALPSASFFSRVNAQLPPATIPPDLAVTSIKTGRPFSGEMKLFPVFLDLNGTMLMAADAAGRVDMVPTPMLSRRVRRSPQDALSVVARNPSDTDTGGYAPGHEWNSPDGLWVAQSVGEAAVWTRAAALSPTAGDAMVGGGLPLPGDALPDEPLFLGGPTRMRTDYDGPIARIRRVSDGATLDITDMAQRAAFGRGTKTEVAGYFIQSGPLRGTLAVADDGYPALAPQPQCGSKFAAVFENSVIYNGTQTPRQAILIPAGITAMSNDVTMIGVGSWSHSGRDIPIAELSGTVPLAFGHSSQSGLESLAVNYSTWRGMNRFQPSLAGQVSAFSSRPDGLSIYGADRAVATFPALPATALAGGTIGRSTRFLAGDGVTQRQGGWLCGGFILYGRGLTAAEVAAVRRSCVAHFDLRPQVRGSLNTMGDSIPDGAGASYFEGSPRRISRLLSRPMNVRNFAISGSTIATQLAVLRSEILPAIQTEGGLPWLLAILGLGTNDIPAGTPLATMQSGMQSILGETLAAGCNGIPFGTIRPRKAFNENPAYEAVRLSHNQWVRNTAANNSKLRLIDYDLLWSTASAEDTTKFFDGTHLTDLGQAMEAAFVAPIINEFLPTIGL